MEFNYNKDYVKFAQGLRKNMTSEERHLWYDFLKRLPVTVNRQKNIGDYIVDFYIASKGIIIEIDGEQHGFEENKEADKVRDKDLEKLGLTVLRYSNSQINKYFEDVCNDILKYVDLTVNDLEKKEINISASRG